MRFIDLLKTRRKGQIFIIVALLVILLIAFFAPATFRIRIGEPELAARLFFDNIRAEFPAAVNVALAENATSVNVANRVRAFYDFAAARATERQLNLTLYYIFGLPVGDTLNITAGNLYAMDLRDLNVTVHGVTRSFPTLGFGQIDFTNFSLGANTTINLTYLVTSDDFETRELNTSVRSFVIAKFRVLTENQLLRDIRSY